MVRLAVFDLDNTLYDYDACNAAAEYSLLQLISERLDISGECAGQMLAGAKKQVKSQLGEVAASHNRLLYMQAVCERRKVNPLRHAMEFYDCYWDTMLREMQPYPYVRPLLAYLHGKGIEVAVLTDLTAHIQYRKLDRLGIAGEVDYLTTSEEAGAEKPSRIIFEKLFSKVPYAPEEMLMVGDSYVKDVQGALAVGMRALLFEKDMDISEKIKGELGL